MKNRLLCICLTCQTFVINFLLGIKINFFLIMNFDVLNLGIKTKDYEIEN